MPREYSQDEVLIAAIAAHEMNRNYCNALGDYSVMPWFFAPLNIRQSAIDGVLFLIQNPDATPEDSHNNWMLFKAEDGWVYGEEKDPERKTHPCMVPYDQLPLHQRTKDYLFKSIVQAHLGIHNAH